MDNSLEPLVLYGAGNNAAEAIANFRKSGCEPICLVDSDCRKQGAEICGIQVLSFSDAAARYPLANWFITPNAPVKYEIREFLTENGIQEENIIGYSPVKHYTSCTQLEGAILISDTQIRFCCGNHRFLNSDIFGKDSQQNMNINISCDAFEVAINSLLNKRSEIIDKNNRDIQASPCNGCEFLTDGYWNTQKQFEFNSVVYDAEVGVCNMKCIYCSVPSKKARAEEHFARRLSLLADKGYIKKGQNGTLVSLSAGEISVDPHRNEILEAVGGYKVHVNSNCLVYNERLSEVMQTPGSFLQVSIDAGTRDTFRRIRGVDGYEKVLGNVKHYIDDGVKTQVKYIVREDNCSDEDLAGFISTIEDLHPSDVAITGDQFALPPRGQSPVVNFAVRVGAFVKRKNMNLTVSLFPREITEYISGEVEKSALSAGGQS